jgi:hypothetical protein
MANLDHKCMYQISHTNTSSLSIYSRLRRNVVYFFQYQLLWKAWWWFLISAETRSREWIDKTWCCVCEWFDPYTCDLLTPKGMSHLKIYTKCLTLSNVWGRIYFTLSRRHLRSWRCSRLIVIDCYDTGRVYYYYYYYYYYLYVYVHMRPVYCTLLCLYAVLFLYQLAICHVSLTGHVNKH